MARKSTRRASGPSTSKKTTKATAKTKASNAIPAAQPIKEGVITFLDLPGEIRNQIYLELLPQVPLQDINTGYSRTPLRNDGQKTSTRFMLACRQVYAEACSILYDSIDAVTLNVHCESGYMMFLGHGPLHAEKGATAADFRVLSRFKSIRLDIQIDEHIDEVGAGMACIVQDSLFVLMDGLRSDHALRSLSVNIQVGENEASWEDRFHDFGWESEPYSSFRVMLMHEFKSIKPGHVSLPHITAFLTDPLRMLRNIQGSNGQSGKFSLSFIGQSGKPWNELADQVRDLVVGDTDVGEYHVFGNYETFLRQLRPIFYHRKCHWMFSRDYNIPWTREPLPDEMQNECFEILHGLHEARVRGNIAQFVAEHEKLLDLAREAILARSDSKQAVSSEQAELWEHGCRELVHLCEELKAALPPADTDTSFFGYSLVDHSLHEWQIHGRKEATQAKRKRRAEVKAEARKKLKASEDD